MPLWSYEQRARVLSYVCVTPAHTCSKTGVRCGRGDSDVLYVETSLGACVYVVFSHATSKACQQQPH
jgi:hypothetical protein